MITMEELKTMREGKNKEAAIIPAGELERIKQSMVVPNYEE